METVKAPGLTMREVGASQQREHQTIDRNDATTTQQIGMLLQKVSCMALGP